MRKRVLVAMSGGVDSSVACYLLERDGFECIGATIKTWPKGECGRSDHKMCCSVEAVDFARAVAHKLNIPHYVFDLSRSFNSKVRNYFKQEYENGRTPNPCVFCNSEIKFNALNKKALSLRCSYIASGHYARIEYCRKTKRYLLKKGKDPDKDQSYFLFNLRQDRLKHILFPLGNMTKAEVRRLAREKGLKSHDRASSQDLCFELPLLDKPGNVYFTDGKILGRHKGIAKYTIGQRKGLGIAYKEPLYVTKIDVLKNAVHLGVKSDTLRRVIVADRINWIKEVLPSMQVSVKIRYRQQDQPAQLYFNSPSEVRVEFRKPLASPSPGQAAVFYVDDIVLGGGWIREVVE